MNDLARVCTELGIRNLEGRIVTDSLAVARHFDKRHANVIRDIEELLSVNSDLSSRKWFRRTNYITSQGRSEPAYELTRDGFVLLVMSYTGLPAMNIKIRYIDTFNAMEAALREPAADPVGALGEIKAMLLDLFAAIPGKIDQAAIMSKLDHAIGKLNTVEDTVVAIHDHQKQRARAKFTKDDKYIMRMTVHWRYGGKCPYSNVQILDQNGNLIDGAGEYDHFNGPNNSGPKNGWLVATEVHKAITAGVLTRQHLQPFFEAYQIRLATFWKPSVIKLPDRRPQQLGFL